MDMGHSHRRSVLIFYGWTFVVAVGCLLFMFLPAVFALPLLVIGLLACTFITFGTLRAGTRPERQVSEERQGKADRQGSSSDDLIDSDSAVLGAVTKGTTE